jgi:hypothetical protein
MNIKPKNTFSFRPLPTFGFFPLTPMPFYRNSTGDDLRCKVALETSWQRWLT